MYVGLALLPVLFGLGDYLGGQFSQRVSPWAVVGITSSVSALAAIGWTIWSGSDDFDVTVAIRGALAGLIFLLAYAMFFKALALGKAGVVGSIVALAVIPPVIADLVRGQLPDSLEMLGIVIVVVGVAVISQPTSLAGSSKTSVLLALGAAACFGIQLVILGRASQVNSDEAVAFQYAAAAIAVGIVGLVKRTRGGVKRADSPRLLGIGVLFGLGGLLLSTCMASMNVAVVTAVLATEPIVLAILGYFLQKERLNPAQVVALVAVIAGAVLSSVG